MTTMTSPYSPDAAKRDLLDLIEADSPVYVINRHVSRSGMTRHLSLYVNEDGAMRDITSRAAAVLGWRLHVERHALIVGGCGMDMHFHTVYSLARALFGGDGYELTHVTL